MFRNSQRRLLQNVSIFKKSSFCREYKAVAEVKILGRCLCSKNENRLAIGHQLVNLGPRSQHQQHHLQRRMSSSVDDTDGKEDSKDKDKKIREASVPNKEWSEKTLKVYNELMDLCKDGKWEKIKSFQNFTANERLFVRSIDNPGKQFEYALFLNREEKAARCVIQFGPWLQGPKGAVHGGAIATVFDSVTGVLVYNLGYKCATVNLNVDFHGFLPLYTTARCNAWVTKVEGRKIYTNAELTSVDGKHVFDKCSALWLALGSTDEDIVKEQMTYHKLNGKY